MKRMGARNAGNPHVACDVEGLERGTVEKPARPARQSSTLPVRGYGILRFDLCSKVVATVKPAAMLSNCPHPARMVLGPGGL